MPTSSGVTRLFSSVLPTLAMLALVAGWSVAARADGDPASDVLATQSDPCP